MKVEIWASHILFTAYNRTFIAACIELVFVMYVSFRKQSIRSPVCLRSHTHISSLSAFKDFFKKMITL